jgi:hypothetical protein
MVLAEITYLEAGKTWRLHIIRRSSEIFISGAESVLTLQVYFHNKIQYGIDPFLSCKLFYDL